MDLLEDPLFKQKYKKSKLKVKLWESDFRNTYGRNPSKLDIRAADPSVRDAYKSYYKLKTLALEDSLMDISFTNDIENSMSPDGPEIRNTVVLNPDKLVDQNVEGRRHRTVLGDIQIDKETGSDISVSETRLSSIVEPNKEIQEQSSCKLNNVWGPHLNKKPDESSDYKIKTFKQRSSSFQFSEKLFVGSKFCKKNPRKSRSFSKPSRPNESDGFPVPSHSMDAEFTTRTLQQTIQPQASDDGKIANFTGGPISEFAFTGLLEKTYKVVTNSTPVTGHTVSVIQKTLLSTESNEKNLILKTVDKGWLDRCTKSNSLEYRFTQLNDSGIESMETSGVTEQCSSTECTPKLMQTKTDHLSSLSNNVNENGVGRDVACNDSDEDIICNSEDSDVEDSPSSRKKRGISGNKRKFYIKDCVSTETTSMTKPTKRLKEDMHVSTEIVKPDDALIEIPSAKDIDKIAEAIVSTEKKVSNSNKVTKRKLSKKEILEKKMATGQLNENFVRINIKKKVYVRGKKNNNFSKYKKAEWKRKKKMARTGRDADDKAGDGLLRCFKCGEVGHFANTCMTMSGDKLLPQEEDEEDSPFPTLEEVEAMAAEPIYANKRKVSLSHLVDQKGADENPDGLDSFKVNVTKSLYELKEDGTLIDTPPEVYEALEKFGHDGFRPGQEEAVMRILSGLSTLVTLSTGAGKSLCYQLPAYMYSQQSNCITLVVSPLVSLMEDQVTGVASCIQAACLHTNQTPQQRQKVIELAKSGQLDVLLVSPEAVVSGERATGFGSILKELPGIAFACIDEVHCVSQWSHNFRPSYLMICKVLREKLGVKTVLGLTATATRKTCASIVKHLSIPDGEQGVIKDVPLPNNLILSVSRDERRDQALISLLQGKRFASCQSIIIYCTRRNECERLAVFIRTCLQDRSRPASNKRSRQLSWNAEPYHAGLSAARRKQVQKAFMSGQLRIVVATVAFGMGINKQDIRAVIHYNMPHDFESYVQEVGRAGRDGLPAHCHLFLDSKGGDLNELRRHVYANSVDRHTIRKLLQRVFVPCKCLRIVELFEGVDFSDNVEAKDSNVTVHSSEKLVSLEEDSGEKVDQVMSRVNCPGHEVAFSVEETVRSLDLPEENVSTMLCYLELHHKQWVKVMSPVYTMCKVQSYRGPKALKAGAKLSPPLAMTIALDQKRGVSHDDSNKIEFPVVEIATAIGWDSGIVKSQLKSLEWSKVNEKWRRSGITVEFFQLGFRVLAPGNLSPSELDEALDTLYEHVESHKQCCLQQLKKVFGALTSVSYSDVTECKDDVDMDRNEKLKVKIREYFEQEQNSIQEATSEETLENEDQIAADVRSLLCMYRDTSFSGRAVARIFHGIASPCYPAQIWGRCRYWRAHMDSDFSSLCKVAAREILRLK